MEMRHLRCFLAVAEELHFARSTEKLHIEQSSLSRTIKELEEDLGEQLFVRTSRGTRHIDRYIIPILGRIKVPDLTRADVSEMMHAYSHIPSAINRAFACPRKMLNMAEVWGYCSDGSKLCRHVPVYPENGKTRFITDEELVRIYEYLIVRMRKAWNIRY
ncbi:hypothetical protein BOTU111921_02915 [Bordetella tumbae]